MKRFSEQLKKKSESIRLRAAEKHDLEARLQAYMEYHPLPTHLKQVAKPAAAVSTESFYILRIPQWVYQSMTGVAVLMLVVTPFAAERAVPGDMLYPVKIKINEEVRSSLASSPYEKIEWETERLERRITEARVLASAGLLTPEIEASVVDAVEAHRILAAASIAELRAIDEAQASLADITLATVLDVQSARLRSNTNASSSGQSTASLTLALEKSSQEVESRSDATPASYDWLMAQVEIETTRTYELLDSIRANATPDQVQELERRLKDIERKIEGAVLAHTTSLEVEQATELAAIDSDVATTAATDTDAVAAVAMLARGASPATDAAAAAQLARKQLRDVLRDTKKLIAYMSDFDLRSSVTIDALLPVVLTDEEWSTALAAQRTALDARRMTLAAKQEEVEDDAVRDKVAAALATVAELEVQAQQAFEAAQWQTAQALQIEIAAYLDSAEQLVVDVMLPSVTDPVAAVESITGSSTDTATSTTGVPLPDAATATSSSATTS